MRRGNLTNCGGRGRYLAGRELGGRRRDAAAKRHRRAYPGDGRISRHESEALLEFDLTPAVHSLAQIAEMDELSRKAARPIRYHLKIDSGMGRMGTRASAEDILQALNAAPHAHLEGLMTHFASAADYSKRQTEEQLAYFHALCERLRRAA